MSLLQITNLWPPFAGQSLEVSEVVVYSPVVHYHTLEGPSRKRRTLEGPSAKRLTIEGPSKRTKQLTGAN